MLSAERFANTPQIGVLFPRGVPPWEFSSVCSLLYLMFPWLVWHKIEQRANRREHRADDVLGFGYVMV